MDTLELARFNRTAFDNLPEAYQNDDVLVFWEDRGNLFGAPAASQMDILGDWTIVFQDGKWDSETSSHYPPLALATFGCECDGNRMAFHLAIEFPSVSFENKETDHPFCKVFAHDLKRDLSKKNKSDIYYFIRGFCAGVNIDALIERIDLE